MMWFGLQTLLKGETNLRPNPPPKKTSHHTEKTIPLLSTAPKLNERMNTNKQLDFPC